MTASLPPTFRVHLPPAQLQQLRQRSTGLVSLLAKLAHGVVHGRPGFPSLNELGLSPDHAGVLGRNLPERFDDVLVLGRLDVTTDGERMFSYELNADQPGGMEYVSLLESPVLPAGALPAGSVYRPYLAAASDHFCRRSGRSQPEGVLLLANGYHLIERLHQALSRHFACPVHLRQAPADATFDGKRLSVRGPGGVAHAIDLVVRSPRVNIYELVSEPYAAVRAAWEREAAVIVNPPHSRVAGCKSLYAYLDDQLLLDRVDATAAEREAAVALVREVVPVMPHNAGELRRNAQAWVLKAPLGGKGSNVHLGPETDPTAWDTLVHRAITEPGWTAASFQPPYALPIEPDDRPGAHIASPTSIDPYVVMTTPPQVAGFLVRAVIPTRDDPAELANVKLNLLGTNRYRASDGTEHTRTIGLGAIRT